MKAGDTLFQNEAIRTLTFPAQYQGIIARANDTNAAALDRNYSVFGRVISGMNVVDAITHVPIYPANDGKPLTDVTLISAEFIS